MEECPCSPRVLRACQLYITRETRLVSHSHLAFLLTRGGSRHWCHQRPVPSCSIIAQLLLLTLGHHNEFCQIIWQHIMITTHRTIILLSLTQYLSFTDEHSRVCSPGGGDTGPGTRELRREGGQRREQAAADSGGRCGLGLAMVDSWAELGSGQAGQDSSCLQHRLMTTISARTPGHTGSQASSEAVGR